jgi:hypothetical protein
MSYFEEPMGRILYYFSCSLLVYEVPINAGKQVPDSILPFQLSLSQSQFSSQEEYHNNDMGPALVDIQAYYVLYPKFKQIVSMSDGNLRISGGSWQEI